jgi:hypothetical protein
LNFFDYLVDFVADVELDHKEQFCFVAGSTIFSEQFENNTGGQAIISAIEIGPKMKSVSSHNFGAEFGCVLSIKKSASGNNLYLGCHTAILEVSFNEKEFSLVNIMKLGKTDIVIDFYISNEGESEG